MRFDVESPPHMDVGKYSRPTRNKKWMEAYQERATARGDVRRASRAAEVRMLLDNWLNNNPPSAVTSYSDYD
jgi:hypothetical protein